MSKAKVVSAKCMGAIKVMKSMQRATTVSVQGASMKCMKTLKGVSRRRRIEKATMGKSMKCMKAIKGASMKRMKTIKGANIKCVRMVIKGASRTPALERRNKMLSSMVADMCEENERMRSQYPDNAETMRSLHSGLRALHNGQQQLYGKLDIISRQLVNAGMDLETNDESGSDLD